MSEKQYETLRSKMNGTTPESVAKTGRMSARERINSLFDAGTFVETSAFLHRITTEFDSEKYDELESVVCGYGAIDGRLCYSFVQDYTRSKGAIGEMHARKICELYALAEKANAPVIGIFDTDGAKISESVSALAGYGKILGCVNSASGRIPQIAVILGNCGGMAAVLASAFDFVIASEQNGKYYINAPMYNADKNASEIKSVAENGHVSVIAADEIDALGKAKKLFAYLPSYCGGNIPTQSTSDDLNRLTPEIQNIVNDANFDIHDIISAIADNGEFFEISDTAAKSAVCGFIAIGQSTIAVVANNPKFENGVLSCAAARKLSHFISVCDTLDIPLLTLVSTDGFAQNDVNPCDLAKLGMVYTKSTNAKVTVNIGNAFGGAYVLMGSKSVGADVVFSLEGARISPLSPKASVALLNGASESLDENAVNEWANTYAAPLNAAKYGQIDDIIPTEQLRQRAAAAFEMLSLKNRVCIAKKHSNMPF